MAIYRLGIQHLPRRPERVQPGQPRRPDVQLQLLTVASSGLLADHSEPRHKGRVLMKSSRFAGMLLLLSGLALAACGGGGFEPASKIKGLRVLALQKDHPYPHVDDGQINLKLLYWDGASKPDRPRNLSFAFVPC